MLRGLRNTILNSIEEIKLLHYDNCKDKQNEKAALSNIQLNIFY